MRKLQALTAHLMTVTGLPRENFQAFADRGELSPDGEDLGHGISLGYFRYDAVISIERFPGSGFELLAVVSAWLADHDPDRDRAGLAESEVNVDLNDDTTADVEIAVEFEERLEIVPDDGGPIEFDGRRWRVADVPVNVAEALDDFDGEAEAVE